MQTQTSSYSDILKKRVKFRSAQELLRRNPYISEALHSRMSTSSMDNTLISASSTISSVDTYFTVNDDLVILPQEIILYILEFNYIKENYIVSFCGKYYFELIHLYILDRVKRFDLREQNYQGKALEALLSRGNLLESIFLTKNFSAQTSIHVTDRLLIGLNKLNAVELRYLHVKACDFISEIGFRAIGDACTNLLVLSKFLRFHYLISKLIIILPDHLYRFVLYAKPLFECFAIYFKIKSKSKMSLPGAFHVCWCRLYSTRT